MENEQNLDPIGIEMGRRLRKARKARGWSQTALAQQTGYDPDSPGKGVHPSSIAMYERGQQRITHEAAREFERVLDMPIAYWLNAVDEFTAGLIVAASKRPTTATGGAP